MLRKRILAHTIDVFVVCIPEIICMVLLTIKPIVITNDFFYNFFNFYTCCGMILIIFKDTIGNRSIGKRIFKLKVVTLQGQSPNFFQIIVRNIPTVIWFLEAFVLVVHDKPRIGDLIARTKIEEETT